MAVQLARVFLVVCAEFATLVLPSTVRGADGHQPIESAAKSPAANTPPRIVGRAAKDTKIATKRGSLTSLLPTPPRQPAPRPYSRPSTDRPDWGRIHEMYMFHNDARSIRGLRMLDLSDELCRVAQEYARLLHATDDPSHTVGGTTIQERLAGYPMQACAENIAWSGPLVSDIDLFYQWMRSPRHAAAIVGNYQEIGIGNCGIYWVVIFVATAR
jgi:uncharacterized protein YkwD